MKPRRNRARLLADPATPIGVLFILGQARPDDFLAHPLVRLQRATCPDWLRSLPAPLLVAILRCDSCPAELTDELSRMRGLPVEARAAAAGRLDLSEVQLRRFVRHAFPVRIALAGNPLLPEDMERPLSCDRHSRVRASIAARTRDRGLLQRMSRDRSLHRVRVAVAGNPSCPPEARLYLSRSRLIQIQHALRDADLRRSRE